MQWISFFDMNMTRAFVFSGKSDMFALKIYHHQYKSEVFAFRMWGDFLALKLTPSILLGGIGVLIRQVHKPLKFYKMLNLFIQFTKIQIPCTTTLKRRENFWIRDENWITLRKNNWRLQHSLALGGGAISYIHFLCCHTFALLHFCLAVETPIRDVK